MSKVVIKLAPLHLRREYTFDVKSNLHQYENGGTFELVQTGEAAAEEIYDFTNNPARQNERVQAYGYGRSISVGDVVEVDGVNYACEFVGWKIVEINND
jgi:hypothetical protein